MGNLAITALVTITEIEIPEQRIVQEALENDILITGGTRVIYTA
jgi:hypothetical protein